MYNENSYSRNMQSNFLNSNIPEHLEMLLNQNKGKKANIYMSFPDSIEWRDKIFSGTIEGSGTNYILIKDNNNNPVVLQKIYINYIEFKQNII